MGIVMSIFRQYYKSIGKSGIDFLRDAIKFLDNRSENQNENKSIVTLLKDFCEHLKTK